MTTIEYSDGTTQEFEDLLDAAVSFDIHADPRDGDDAVIMALFDKLPTAVVIDIDGEVEFWAGEYKPEGWGV